MAPQKSAAAKTPSKRKAPATAPKSKAKKAKTNPQTKAGQQPDADDETDDKAEAAAPRQLSDEEITKHKKAAIAYFKSEDITKVNIVWKKESLTEGTPKLAGYCHFASTTALRTFWTTGPAATGPLNEWRMSKVAAFGVPDAKPDKTTVSTKVLWQVLTGKSQSRIELSPATLNTELPLPKYTTLCDEKERPTLTTLITMHRLISLCPEVFDPESEESSELLGLHTGENWYRALCLILGYWRYVNKVMKPLDPKEAKAFNADGSWSASDKAQEKPAEKPLFLTPDDWAGIISDNQQQLANPSDAAISDVIRAATATFAIVSQGLIDERRHGDDTAKYLKDLERLYRTLDESPRNPSKYQPTRYMDLDEKMIPLKPESRNSLLEQIGQQVQILYPLDDEDLTLPFASKEIKALDPEVTRIAEDAQLLRELDETNAQGTVVTESSLAAQGNFWRLQRAINQAGAKSLTLEAACEFLGYDINHVRFHNPELPDKPPKGIFYPYPWQVVGAAWLIMAERSKLRAGLLADEPGVGKTITSLMAIEASVLLRSRRVNLKVPSASNVPPAGEGGPAQPPKATGSPAGEARKSPAGDLAETRGPTYKPTLIVVPSISTGVWGQEFKVFPNFKVYYYLGSRSHLKGSSHLFDAAHRTLPNDVHELRRKVKSLDPYDPQTGRTLFLTTYGAWHNRTLDKDSKYETPTKPKSKASKGKSKVPEETLDEDLDPEEESDEEEMTESEAMKYISRAEGLFYRVICDEAHKLRSPKTKTSLAILKLGKIVRYLLSATPMINKPADLYGILMQIFMDEWAIHTQEAAADPDENGDTVMEDVKKTLTLEDFEAATENLDHIDFDSIDEFTHLLEPSAFWKFSHPPGGKQMNALTASKVLPPILRQIQLRRAMGDAMTVNSKEVVIGQGIPPYEIITVELRMTRAQKEFYLLTHHALAGYLSKGADKETQEGLMNMTVHRTLCHAVADGRLTTMEKRLSAKSGLNVSQLNIWHDQSLKEQMFQYWAHTARDMADLPHVDCLTNAFYMCMLSPKMQYLARLLRWVVFELKERIIIFVDWPSTLFVYKLFLQIVGVKHVAIMANQKPSERDALINQFNDKTNDLGALLASQRTSSSSLNLQAACRFMVILEGFSSPNNIFQCGGRMFRIGQLLAQKIWQVTVDQTYDQKIQYRAALKMIGQIAAQNLNLDLDRGHMDDEAAEVDALNEGLSLDERKEMAEQEAIETKAKELLRQVLGQRTSRAEEEWGDVEDLELKDFRPENLEYLARNDLTDGVSKRLRDASRCLSLSQFDSKEVTSWREGLSSCRLVASW